MKNQAAFPSPGVVIPSGPGSATTPHQQGAYEGMTLRDYFAAKAMQALMDEWVSNPDSFDSIEQLAEAAYEYADAMLAERDRQP